MKKSFTKVLLAAAMFCVSSGAAAYSFIAGGIYYNITSETYKTVEVTSGGNGYVGDVSIPATVENGGTIYTVTEIGDYAFYDCSSLESVTLGQGIKTIGEAAFASSSLVSIDIPDGVKSIEVDAFYNCSSLESVTLGSGVETIGDYAFEYCENLKSINIPDGVVSIGDYAFDGCSSLTSIDIPDGVVSLGEGAFSGCISLESVTLGSEVETIGDYAFHNCSNLVEINSLATLPPVCAIIAGVSVSSCFSGVDKTACTLKVPEGTAGDYRAADVWKEFFNIAETDFAGIGEIAADAAAAAKVYAAAGRIVVENAAAGTPIAVYTADGVQVYGGTVSGGRTEIPAQAGKLYIVRCGNAAYKTAM